VARRGVFDGCLVTGTLERAQKDLAGMIQKALRGEPVLITMGTETMRLSSEVPLRPPGFLADCYCDAEDAAFEARVCHDSVLVVEP